MQNLISIVMPAYNAEATIASSIKSVLSQTYPFWILYVVDDGSSDKTAEIVRSFSEIDHRIRYLHLSTNLGVAAARNYAIDLVNTDFIAFLDSDDIWCENKLKRQLDFLLEGYDVVCSDFYYFVDSPGNVVKFSDKLEQFSYDNMLKGNNIGNLTGVYNCKKLGKIKQISMGHEDYAMWLDVMKLSSSAYCIKEYLAFHRISGVSVSSNKFKAAIWHWKILRTHVGLSFFSASYYFVFYIFNALLGRVRRISIQ